MKDLKLSYYGRVKDGEIILPSKRLRKEVVKAFEGHSIEFIVKRKRRQRSNPQNRFYFGVVIPIILQEFINLGNDLQTGNPEHVDLIHSFLKERFLDNGIEFVDLNGEVHKGPSSTTYCTTVEFMEYIDKIAHWAAESLNVVIPEPNEQLEAF